MNCVHWNQYAVIHYIIISFCACSIKISDGSGLDSNSVYSNGFGDSYEWHSLEEGLALAKNEGKPVMVIIHRSDCSACSGLKSKFSVSETTIKLSKYFVMVNIPISSKEKFNEEFSPDGKYVPRIIFLDSRGLVHTEIFNRNGNPEYKYFYHDMVDVAAAMKKALSLLHSSGAQEL